MMDRLRHFFRPDMPRLELMQNGGFFTVRELREFGLGPEKREEHGGVSREFLYVNDEVPVRLIPGSLLAEVQRIWDAEHDAKKVIEVLYTSFYLYRDCVNRELEVPLVRKDDGNWEWPEPDGFAWGDDQARALAFILGAYRRRTGVTMKVIEGNIEHTLQLATGVVDSSRVSEIVAHPDKYIKFHVPNLQDVRMVNQEAWQKYALRTWAGRGGLGTAFDSILEGTLDSEWAGQYIMSMVDNISSTPINFPVVRYAHKNEKGPMGNLFILEF